MAKYALKAFGFSIPFGIFLADTVGYVARVDGSSMQPTLNPDQEFKFERDYVYLSKWAVRNFDLDRGDIVSVKSPKNPKHTLIKRIIGLHGDVITTKGYRKSYVQIPPGHCWVEGDNTGHSYDSNAFGPISTGLITAKATHIVWPPSRWQSISTPQTKSLL